jgi:hypothetical protein
MEKLTLIIIIGAAVVAYGVGYFLYSRYRWQKADIPGIVEREVAKRDGTLVSIEKTGPLDTGPFPKVEASGPAPGRPVIVSTAIPLGDRTFYKKVVWDDRRGTRHSSWIKLDFVPFYKLHDVTWKDGC